ncbi:MAG: hypothetical protein FWE10_02695 [Rikenellaceae bacterium]|nr:hypothetical protein [Rikenellaceae bacterium]MCL2692782.1 hypothetical protein [Rikenellaceae bacterium]
MGFRFVFAGKVTNIAIFPKSAATEVRMNYNQKNEIGFPDYTAVRNVARSQ